MNVHVLKNKHEVPSDIILSKFLGASYPIFKRFIDSIKSDKYSLIYQWNYYKDGEIWLCKIMKKKKTICWLSVYEDFFKLSFIFNQKTEQALSQLGITDRIIKRYYEEQSMKKLKSLVVDIKNSMDLGDAYKLIEYKLYV